MAELKPCPFCGERIKDCFANVHALPNDGWIVTHWCKTDDDELGVTIDVYRPTKKEAIEAWNRRVDNAKSAD